MNLIFFKGIYSFCIPLYIYLIIYLFILIYIIKWIQFYIYYDMLNTFLLNWFQFLKFLFPPIRSVFKYWITTSVGLVLPRGIAAQITSGRAPLCNPHVIQRSRRVENRSWQMKYWFPSKVCRGRRPADWFQICRSTDFPRNVVNLMNGEVSQAKKH